MWTYREWCGEMRKAGWRSIGQGAWQHGISGVIFTGWSWTAKRAEGLVEPVFRGQIRADGEAWVPFALKHETPPAAS